MNRREFEAAIRSAPTEHDRIAWFGALLAADSKLRSRLIIVGGSAIEVYLSSERYVTNDIDVVGRKAAIVPVLKRWGFTQKSGRDQRVYWAKPGLGLVDLVGPTSRAGLPARRQPTPYGDAFLGPVEALVIRRLIRASREKSQTLFRQAEALATEYSRKLDWDYLRAEAKYEQIGPMLEELRKRVGAST
jgi:hypothetical protein